MAAADRQEAGLVTRDGRRDIRRSGVQTALLLRR